MATKIESGWKKVIASQQQEVKAEPGASSTKFNIDTNTATRYAAQEAKTRGDYDPSQEHHDYDRFLFCDSSY